MNSREKQGVCFKIKKGRKSESPRTAVLATQSIPPPPDDFCSWSHKVILSDKPTRWKTKSEKEETQREEVETKEHNHSKQSSSETDMFCSCSALSQLGVTSISPHGLGPWDTQPCQAPPRSTVFFVIQALLFHCVSSLSQEMCLWGMWDYWSFPVNCELLHFIISTLFCWGLDVSLHCSLGNNEWVIRMPECPIAHTFPREPWAVKPGKQEAALACHQCPHSSVCRPSPRCTRNSVTSGGTIEFRDDASSSRRPQKALYPSQEASHTQLPSQHPNSRPPQTLKSFKSPIQLIRVQDH